MGRSKFGYHYLVSGCILLSSLLFISHAARRYTRYPGQAILNRQMNPSINTDSTPSMNRDTPDMGNTQPKLNTGTLSDMILSVLRPTINGATNRPTNRNNRGRFRPLPPAPQTLNYTVQDISERFPWIVNPQSVEDILAQYLSFPTSSSRTSGSGGTNSRRRDGRIRFNNPRYLRDWFEGLNLDDYDFKTAEGVLAANGKYKVRLNQKWRNIPVYGSSVVMEQENDTNFILESADGQFLSGIEEDISSEVPTLTSQEAIDRALAHNMDQGKVIRNPTAKLIVDTVGDTAVLCYLINYVIPGEVDLNPIPTTETAPPLSTTTTTTEAPQTTTNRWYRRQYRRTRRSGNGRSRTRRRRDDDNSNGDMSPITSSTSTTTETPDAVLDILQRDARNMWDRDPLEPTDDQRFWMILNANTGEVVRRWNGLASATTFSRVSLRVGLVRASETYHEFLRKDTDTDECFYQRALAKDKYLTVSDVKELGSRFRHAYKFLCEKGAAEDYDITNGAASPRNSAYKWAFEAINLLRRSGMSRIKFSLDVEVHHTGPRAYWTGKKIVLGDGDDRYFYPMTGPDIVAHEIAHAFTENLSGLEYNGQSGAISEAFSDMTASAFLNYFYNDDSSAAYMIGRKVSKLNVAMRDMCNPRSDRLLFYNPAKPIIISANQWELLTPPHNASALYNKAFCELSKMPDWGISTTFRVFAMANLVYWKPSETFSGGACGVREAAFDLKGTNQSKLDVDRAFSRVDITCSR